MKVCISQRNYAIIQLMIPAPTRVIVSPESCTRLPVSTDERVHVTSGPLGGCTGAALVGMYDNDTSYVQLQHYSPVQRACGLADIESAVQHFPRQGLVRAVFALAAKADIVHPDAPEDVAHVLALRRVGRGVFSRLGYTGDVEHFEDFYSPLDVEGSCPVLSLDVSGNSLLDVSFVIATRVTKRRPKALTPRKATWLSRFMRSS